MACLTAATSLDALAETGREAAGARHGAPGSDDPLARLLALEQLAAMAAALPTLTPKEVLSPLSPEGDASSPRPRASRPCADVVVRLGWRIPACVPALTDRKAVTCGAGATVLGASSRGFLEV